VTNYDQVLANVLAMNGGALPAGVQPPQAVAQQLQDAGTPAPTDGVQDTSALLPSSPGTADQVQPETAPESGVSPPNPGVSDAGVTINPQDVVPLPPAAQMQPGHMGLTPTAPSPATAPLPPTAPAPAPAPVPPVSRGTGSAPGIPAVATPQSAANDIENARVAGQNAVDKGAAYEGLSKQAEGEAAAEVDPARIAADQRAIATQAHVESLANQAADRMTLAVSQFNDEYYQSDHLMRTRTTAQKWEIGLSMVLGAIGAGSTGVNAGVQVYQENLKRDLEMQKLQFDHDKDAVGAYAELARTLQTTGLTGEEAQKAATIAFNDQNNAIMRTKLFQRGGAQALTAFDTAKAQQAFYADQSAKKQDLDKTIYANRKAQAEAAQAYGSAGLAGAEARKTNVETKGLEQQQEFTKEALGGQLGGGGGTNEQGLPVPNGAQRAFFQQMGYDVPVGIPGVAPAIGGKWNLQPKAAVEQATAASKPIETIQSYLQRAHDIRARNGGAAWTGQDLTDMREIEGRLPELMDAAAGSGAINNRNFGLWKNIAGNINASRIWPGNVQAGIEHLYNQLEDERVQKLAPFNPQRQAMRARPVE